MPTNIIKRCITLLMISLISAACSETVKGPITGKKYNVNISSCGDPETYKKAREEAKTPDDAIEPATKPRELTTMEDCPGSVREGFTE